MTKLEKYLKEVEESVVASYKIGTQTPAFREDAEVLLKMVNEILTDQDGDLDYIKFKIESLIPESEGGEL